MAAFGKQIFVLGGDSNAAFAQTRTEDPNVIHVLDTGENYRTFPVIDIRTKSGSTASFSSQPRSNTLPIHPEAQSCLSRQTPRVYWTKAVMHQQSALEVMTLKSTVATGRMCILFRWVVILLLPAL